MPSLPLGSELDQPSSECVTFSEMRMKNIVYVLVEWSMGLDQKMTETLLLQRVRWRDDSRRARWGH